MTTEEKAQELIRKMGGKAWKSQIAYMYGYASAIAFRNSVTIKVEKEDHSGVWAASMRTYKHFTPGQLASLLKYVGFPPYENEVLNPKSSTL